MKGLPYKTHWLNFTDIKPEWKKLGLAERPAGSLIPYTVPSIYDPNTKRLVNDSTAIAEYLDEQYPDGPALIPPRTKAIQRAFVDQNFRAIADTFTAFVNIIFQSTNECDKEYFRTSREAWFGGMKLEDVAPKGEAIEGMIKGTEKYLNELAGWLDAAGPNATFFGGDQPLFVDVDVVSYFVYIKRVGGKDHPITKAVMTANGGRWEKYTEAFSKWTERSV
jgi:glutathione S-transferase